MSRTQLHREKNRRFILAVILWSITLNVVGVRTSVAASPDENLAKTARYFADYMARTDNYGHTADGRQPSARATEHGYDYCVVAENIAYQFSSTSFETGELVDGFVEGWKQSPGHRKNILDDTVIDTGVAVAYSDHLPKQQSSLASGDWFRALVPVPPNQREQTR